MQVLFSHGLCSDINSKSNIQFEIDGKGVQRVLTDLTMIKANGPMCSYTSNNSVEYTHHFKVDSGASGNLLPLCLYRKIFPNVTQVELERSIDHRVQLLAYNKKVIKQLGVCYLHVKNSKGHTKLCKFFIVNSKLNPIIGGSCAFRLGLITFKAPIYQNWSNNMSIDSVDKHDTNATCIAGVLSGNDPLKPMENATFCKCLRPSQKTGLLATLV